MRAIAGTVMRGAGYGRKLGFPTVNLDRREYARKKYAWKLGVYAGTATLLKNDKSYPAGIVLGPRDRSGHPKIEAHLIGFPATSTAKKSDWSFGHFSDPLFPTQTKTHSKSRLRRT